MRDDYRAKRDLLAGGLDAAGFEVYLPDGTYFLMAGHPQAGDDREFCRRLATEARVAAIPPSAFYSDPGHGAGMVRFAFCKDETTLQSAIERLGAFL